MGKRFICFFFLSTKIIVLFFHFQTSLGGPHCIKYRSSSHKSILIVMNNFGEKRLEPLSKASKTFVGEIEVFEFRQYFRWYCALTIFINEYIVLMQLFSFLLFSRLKKYLFPRKPQSQKIAKLITFFSLVRTSSQYSCHNTVIKMDISSSDQQDFHDMNI